MLIRKEQLGRVTVHPFPNSEPHSYVTLQRLPTAATSAIYDDKGFFPGSRRGEKMTKLNAAVREVVKREMVDWGADEGCDCVQRRKDGLMPLPADGSNNPCGFWDGDAPGPDLVPLELNDANKVKFLDTVVRVDGDEMAVYNRIDSCVKEQLGVAEGN